MSKKISKLTLLAVVVIGLLLIVTGLFYSSFALIEPVKSVSFQSEKLNYNEQEPGSFQIEKSAIWKNRGEAEVTIDVDTILKRGNRYTDIIFVLDISESMVGKKLEQAKTDIKQLFSTLLSTPTNKIALITFDQNATILSEFTDDQNLLNNKIDGIYDKQGTNYYQALKQVNEILKNYQSEEDRDCVVMFLTDGIPNVDTPNEKTYFNYLKKQYPYMVVNAIQYELNDKIINQIKDISDYQYLSTITNLKDTLQEASIVPVPYNEFLITDYINTAFFEIEDIISDYKVEVDKKNGKVIWNLKEMRSGTTHQIKYLLHLKDELIDVGGVYPISKTIEIKSEIEKIKENIESELTPKLKDLFRVRYDANIPKGCNIKESLPQDKNHFIFDTVTVADDLTCDGYQFKGWSTVTEDVNRPTEEYFVMPSDDVIIRAEWTTLSFEKSINGEIYVYISPILRSVSENDNNDLWEYKESITKIVFQNSIHNIEEATKVFDISEGKNYGVVGSLVPNVENPATFTAYIQGDGKIIASENSSYLFYCFKNLKTIEGLENLDTSNVTNMYAMFSECNNLVDLDVSHFNTSNVTNMSYTFYGCRSLTNLDIDNFNTSKVTNMKSMFQNCINLLGLDLVTFDTSKVTNMVYMFMNCQSLIELNVTSFDTSNVTQMYDMFNECSSLTSLDVSSFNTSKITGTNGMFYGCRSLTSLDVSNFDVSKVTLMTAMFSNCTKLTSINLTNWNTSNVVNLTRLFEFCNQLTTIDLSSFNTSKVIYFNSMFSGCTTLTELDLSNFDTSSAISMHWMFTYCYKLSNLNISSFNTSKVTDMQSMFFGNNSLTSLDVSHFDTSNVTDMVRMFYDCSNLTELDLSNFNTQKITSTENLFGECKKLKNLNISNFKTDNVTNMYRMFHNCCALTNLNLSNFNTYKVTNMEAMFGGCFSLTSLDLSNFNTMNVSNMKNVFSQCSGLGTLDLSNFNTANATDMRYMFAGCWGLTDLNLSSFNTSKVVDMRYMFYNCTRLKSLDFNNFDTSVVTNMEFMFNLCYNLSLTITIANQNITGYDSMFVDAATQTGAQIVVNYIPVTDSLVDQMIATKSANSDVIKGNNVSHRISLISDIATIELEEAVPNKVIPLEAVSENQTVKSFKLNGNIINGRTFKMPEEDVTITDVEVAEITILETNHNPYSTQLVTKNYEKTYDGAKSLTVILEYETENINNDYLYIYDSNNNQYGKYGGNTRKTETIILSGGYIKISFKTNLLNNNFYGFKATVIPNY